MSDATVAAALRSDAPMVVVEAPAGCGKTHQGAEYGSDVAASNQRVLIVTHTHAACSVFAERTRGLGRHVEIRTIDSLIGQIAGAYHLGLGLPADIPGWTRRTKKGHALLAGKVAQLLNRHPMVAAALAARYPTIICDEHQDCSGDQHALVIALRQQGSQVRIFGDPMQHIYKEDQGAAVSPPCDWEAIARQADVGAALDTPHRWNSGCSELGRWTLDARRGLKSGERIDLTRGLPPSVSVVWMDNVAQTHQGLLYSNRRPIDEFERASGSLLILTRYNRTAHSCRAMLGRRLPLWEGHTRPALETLVDAMIDARGDAGKVAAAVVDFVGAVGKGFSPSSGAKRFIEEAASGCAGSCRGKPAQLQALARHIVDRPDHRGVAAMLGELVDLSCNDAAFKDVELDGRCEFYDAIRIGQFDDLETGLAEITNRRTYSRPRPPTKAISNIHKAKGLEYSRVALMPCDAQTFPDKPDARCLLYVALSRAKSQLLIVASRTNPSPLFTL